MQPSTLEKIKELARRGIGGEKITAQRILREKGISWDEPIKNHTHFSPPPEVIEKFKFELRYPSDPLLISLLADKHCTRNRIISMDVFGLHMQCTMKEYMKITMDYEKRGIREKFFREMNRLGNITISKL